MKGTPWISTIFLLLVLAASAPAVIFDFQDAPGDNPEIRKFINKNRTEVQQQEDACYDLFRKYLWPLRSKDASRVFGHKLKKLPHGYVLPTFMPEVAALSGFTPIGIPDRRHTDFYEVGNVAYLELYFHIDGQSMETAVIFFRSDASFTPLKSVADVSKRIAWDKEKWALAKAWLTSHLPEDLRQDEPHRAADPEQGKSHVLQMDIRKMWRLVPYPGKKIFVPPNSAVHAAERVFNTVNLVGMTSEQVHRTLHVELRSPQYAYSNASFHVDGTGRRYPKDIEIFNFNGGDFGLQYTVVYGLNGRVSRVVKQVSL